MDCHTGYICLWVAAAVLLAVIVVVAGAFLYRKLKSFKRYLVSLCATFKETAAQAEQSNSRVVSAVEKAAGASEKAIALSGKIRTEMTAYHTAVMSALEKKKKNWDDFPETIMDKVMPLKNNDGTVYGFKMSLADGSSLIAVIHSLQKDDLPKEPDFARSYYTLMQYDAEGELQDVRTDPIVKPQE